MRLGRVQIIFQRVLYACDRNLCEPGHGVIGAIGKLGGRQAQLKIPQTIDRSGSLPQAVPGEVELVAVRHRREQVTNRRGLVTFEHQVPRREKVSQAF